MNVSGHPDSRTDGHFAAFFAAFASNANDFNVSSFSFFLFVRIVI
jgi:hypothetical protein